MFNTTFCTSTMTAHECESAILRHYIDKNQAIAKVSEVQSKDVKRMTTLLEGYLRKTRLVCYGGTAINNILPKEFQFYDHELDTPDYDFYSPTPIDSAKEIADMYHAAGFTEVEAKSGTHRGTMKVFVNFIGIADITLLDQHLFDVLQKEAIVVQEILYAPPDFLRMNAYVELSRPLGDVSRWEKVNKRLNLLNRFYPMKPKTNNNSNSNSKSNSKTNNNNSTMKQSKEDNAVCTAVKNILVKEGAVFFGGYASSFYAKYMSQSGKQFIYNTRPDFDAFIKDPEKCVQHVQEQAGVKDIVVHPNPPVGEIVPPSYTLLHNNVRIATIFGTTGCHNYNRIYMSGHSIHIATIDTMLNFLLALYFTNIPNYNRNDLYIMAYHLLHVQNKTKLLQKGILKRFNSSCQGTQMTLGDIKAEKANIVKLYKDKKKDAEYDLHMFKYVP